MVDCWLVLIFSSVFNILPRYHSPPSSSIVFPRHVHPRNVDFRHARSAAPLYALDESDYDPRSPVFPLFQFAAEEYHETNLYLPECSQESAMHHLIFLTSEPRLSIHELPTPEQCMESKWHYPHLWALLEEFDAVAATPKSDEYAIFGPVSPKPAVLQTKPVMKRRPSLDDALIEGSNESLKQNLPPSPSQRQGSDPDFELDVTTQNNNNDSQSSLCRISRHYKSSGDLMDSAERPVFVKRRQSLDDALLFERSDNSLKMYSASASAQRYTSDPGMANKEKPKRRFPLDDVFF
jgi:hypothetical protein